MGKKVIFSIFCLFFWICLIISPQNVFSASLPKSTQSLLKKLKLKPSLLADIDQELKVPKEWTEKAKKEGKLRIMSITQPRIMKGLLAPFKERYPFIKIKYSRSARRERIKVLESFRSGRFVTDVLSPISHSTFFQWEKAGGLEDLRTIPLFKNVIDAAKGPNGLVVGLYGLYWCMGYNTRLVSKKDLPKSWDDLLTNPIWRGGNLGLGNREFWFSPLWKVKGEKWAKSFFTGLFTEVKPQLRKESLSALIELVAAGEFHAVIPANNGSTYRLSLKGAPVGFTCPEPAPIGMGYAGVLKGAPNVNSARIFINWLLSKEGQLAIFHAMDRSPARKDFNLPELIRYGDNIFGKKTAAIDFEFGRTTIPAIVEFWKDTWLRRRK